MTVDARDVETYPELLATFQPRPIRSEREVAEMSTLIDVLTDLPTLSAGPSSLRLPRDEFRLLKQEADRRHVSMSELTRTALRFYMDPRATGSLSATALYHLHVTSYTPVWAGGIGNPAQVEYRDPSSLGAIVPAQQEDERAL